MKGYKLKLEAKFYQEIKKNLSNVYFERIENRIGQGTPDLKAIYNKKEIWIELKCIKLNSIKLSKFQIAWHFKRNSLGIKTFIMVKRVTDGLIKVYDNKKVLQLAKNGFKCPCFMVLEPRTDYKKLLKMFD